MGSNLVYIPSSVLLKNGYSESNITNVQILPKPGVFLVVGENKEKNSYRIFYKGKKWYVAKKDTFSVEKGTKENDS